MDNQEVYTCFTKIKKITTSKDVALSKLYKINSAYTDFVYTHTHKHTDI